MAQVVQGQKPHGVDHADVTETVAMCESSDWVAEQKFDGTRAMIHYDGHGQFQLMHHGGGPLKHTAATQWRETIFASLPLTEFAYQLDGELLCESGTYVVFDLLGFSDPRDDEEQWPLVWKWKFEERRKSLEMLATEFGSTVQLARQYRTFEEKCELVRRAYEEMYEGVVFKRKDAPVQPGKRVKTQLKLKFYRECDAIVTERNVGGGCNARLAVYEDGEMRPIGGCSMIGKPDAQPGDVAEVRYLYATASYTLYQPNFVRIRDDKSPAECTIDQLVAVQKGLMA